MTEINNRDKGASIRRKVNTAFAKTDLLTAAGNDLSTAGGLLINGPVEMTDAIKERNYTFPALVATETTPVDIDPGNGTHQKITINRAVTFTSSIADGENVTLIMNNTGSPVHTITWFDVTWVTDLGGEPDVRTNDAVTFWRFGTTIYAAHIGGWN